MQVKVVIYSNNKNNREVHRFHKVRESRFFKVRDRQVNTFNRLMDNKDRELTAQPLGNTLQMQAQSSHNKLVINLSSTPLSQAKESLLSKGPNYVVAPNPHLEYITSIESACQKLDHQEAEEIKANINRILRSSHLLKLNLTKEELMPLAELRKDSNRIVLTVDKGVAMVVMDRKDYIDKATTFLSQPAYRTIDRDPTNQLKAKLITLLRNINKGNRIRIQHP